MTMIPVRVAAGMKPVLANESRFTVQPEHPAAGDLCPACDMPLFGTPREDGGMTMEPAPVVLVFVGIAPADRKPGGWTTGGAVAVHAVCAGVPETEPEADPDA
jgi:hypothetical protein